MNIKYDQHFLEDENILNLIIECSDIRNDDIILEIGCGKGALSRKILQKNPKKLICVERDEKIEPNIKNHNNFELVYANGLTEIEKYDFNKIISNIPYSITEPLFKKILNKKVVFVVMMCGRDFYKNLCSSRNSKWKYFVNAFYDLKLVKEVSGDKFRPKTKVKSVIVKLELKQNINAMERFFQELWKRKKRNTFNAVIFSLVDLFNIPKSDAKELIRKLKLREEVLRKTLDNLSNEEFIHLIENTSKLVKLQNSTT